VSRSRSDLMGCGEQKSYGRAANRQAAEVVFREELARGAAGEKNGYGTGHSPSLLAVDTCIGVGISRLK
jgi:hypothetical protein